MVRSATLAFAAIGVVSSAFASRRVGFDFDTLDIGEYRAYAKLAKEFGATHLAACQIEPSMWQWNSNRHDPYPNWSMHRPSLFKFIVPAELEKYLPRDYAERNLARLKDRVKVLDEFGFRAAFTGQEPAYLPEAAYRDHPAWRGPRCDQCARARTEYYAPCLDNPELRAIYVRTVREICEIGKFESFDLMSNDSGAGLCWYPYLYPGANGPEHCRRDKTLPQRIVDFLSIFQEGAALAGYGDMRVNLNRYLSDDIVEMTLPKLKPGMKVRNRTMERQTAVNVIGFPNPFDEQTYPVYAMPRMPALVAQLQRAEADPEGDALISVRSLDEIDTIRLLRTYWGGNAVGQGKQARYAALNAIAATFVGRDRSEALVSVWDAIEKCYARWGWAETGGHIFLLGTTHQRWLTRPLVCFPNELKPEERDYYRAYQFQAREESCADDLVDLQAHRWLKGYGGTFAVSHTARLCQADLDGAISTASSLIRSAADPESGKYLAGLVLKLKLYRAVMVNAENMVAFQHLMDEGKARNDVGIHHEQARMQDDPGFELCNMRIRREVENTHLIIGVLEESRRLGIRVIRTADRPEFTNVMNLAPVPQLIEELKRKVEVTENHRRDVIRIYRQNNR